MGVSMGCWSQMVFDFKMIKTFMWKGLLKGYSV